AQCEASGVRRQAMERMSVLRNVIVYFLSSPPLTSHALPLTIYRTALYHSSKCDGRIPIQYRNRSARIKRIVRNGPCRSQRRKEVVTVAVRAAVAPFR